MYAFLFDQRSLLVVLTTALLIGALLFGAGVLVGTSLDLDRVRDSLPTTSIPDAATLSEAATLLSPSKPAREPAQTGAAASTATEPSEAGPETGPLAQPVTQPSTPSSHERSETPSQGTAEDSDRPPVLVIHRALSQQPTPAKEEPQAPGTRDQEPGATTKPDAEPDVTPPPPAAPSPTAAGSNRAAGSVTEPGTPTSSASTPARTQPADSGSTTRPPSRRPSPESGATSSPALPQPDPGVASSPSPSHRDLASLPNLEYEPVEEPTEEGPETATPRFTIQVGAFARAKNAQRRLRALQEKGYDPFIEVIWTEDDVQLHSVRIGQFLDHGQAHDEARRYEALEGEVVVVRLTPAPGRRRR